ncbi:TlpA family protein disulfide reductase [Sphingobacterium rhinopitheci]|uniref:TlpA family protein disulfide reductase n=1 Tax=Sphingobacterium rhinopitheci TaxID=2781960 RepID=UPI001F51A231|nr:TlpA disulfide reductase family protein [Sphingobacterium rhinopitheci]MCI0922403.1 TlpA family protein disulfide reductase [Sphingobacterium rhinopitheci]
MMNFYWVRRGLLIRRVPHANILKSLSILFIVKMGKLALKVLKTNDREGYAKYLASLIYEYQLKLKYALDAEEHLNFEKQKRSRKDENCKSLEFNWPSTLIAFFYPSFNNSKVMITNNTVHLLTGFLLLFTQLIIIPVRGQNVNSTTIANTPLKIGEKVPDNFWTKEHLFYVNGDTIRKNLSEYKGKLLIFDFWATWCKSCIEGFPKVDLLQKKFSPDINFILVNCSKTKDSKDKIASFVDRYTSSYEIAQPMLVLDEYLQDLFPHVGIPHFVWINSDGAFLANTHPNEVNYNYISEVLAGNTSAIHQKIDEHLSTVSAFGIDTLGLIQRNVFKNYVEGAQADAGTITRYGNYHRFQFINQYLNSLCYMAYPDELNGVPLQYFIYDKNLNANTKKLLLNSSQYDMFCFEFLTNDKLEHNDVKFKIQNLLKQQFNLVLYRGMAEKDVYGVHVNDKIYLHQSDGKIEERQMNPELGPLYYKNMSLYAFILGMREYISLPIIMDAVPNLKIDIYFSKPFETMTEEEILAFLSQYGIDFIPKRENIVYVEFKSYNHG